MSALPLSWPPPWPPVPPPGVPLVRVDLTNATAAAMIARVVGSGPVEGFPGFQRGQYGYLLASRPTESPATATVEFPEGVIGASGWRSTLQERAIVSGVPLAAVIVVG